MLKKYLFVLSIFVFGISSEIVYSADKAETPAPSSAAEVEDPLKLTPKNTFGLVTDRNKDRPFAKAFIRSASDPDKILGQIVFMEAGQKGLFVQGIFKGTEIKEGFYGVHIHEIGNCQNGGASAGNHFNPLGIKHGFLPRDRTQGAHLGDMGNVRFFPNGSGFLGVILPDVHLSGREANVVGLSVVLDSGRDDFSETADSGDPIGCGIIELLKP